MAENEPSDLIILDIMLPVIDGLTILRRLRKKGIRTPVLMLTAKNTVGDKVAGLDGGADDYLTKPFAFEELLARIRALLRRESDVKSSVIVIEDLTIDMNSHEVRRKDRQIELSAREYALLEYMALNKNKALSRTVLSEHLYDHDFDLDSNVIDVFINRLRNKVDRGFAKDLILTLRGAGYMLKG
jgi:DNA-binding response OmpR family regulator